MTEEQIEKYPLLEKYGYPEELVSEFETIVKKCCRIQNDKLVKYLMSNNGNLDEVETIGIHFYHLLTDYEIVKKIPNNYSDFEKNRIYFLKRDITDFAILELIIRFGVYTDQIFNAKFFSGNYFKQVLGEAQLHIIPGKVDNIPNYLLSDNLLLGFKRWLDSNVGFLEFINKWYKWYCKKENISESTLESTSKQIFTTYFFDGKKEWCKPVDILASSIQEAQEICGTISIKGYTPNERYETGTNVEDVEIFEKKAVGNNYFIHPRER